MNPRRSNWLTIMPVVVSLWLLFCGLILLWLWPWRPATALQWVLFVVLGPIVWSALEYVGGLILSPKVGARISPRRFSWLRICYGVIAFLLCLAVVYGAMYLVGNAIATNDA